MATLAERAEILRPIGLTPLLSTAELCAWYGVDPWTVNEWVKKGLKAEPVAMRGRRFDLDKVRAWQAQHDPQAQSEPELVAAGA